VLLYGLGVAGVIELLQFFVYTRMADATDPILGAAAVGLGWFAGQVFVDRWHEALRSPAPESAYQQPLQWWPLAFVVWLAVVAYFSWRPFNFTADPTQFITDHTEYAQYGLRRFSWLPFVDYYWGSKYNALDQFLRKTLAFLPLGVLGSLWQRRLYQRGAGLTVVGLAFVAAVLLEVGSYFLPGRLPSSTDVLIACVGAWLGFALTQHIRSVFWAERALFGYLHQFSPHPVNSFQ
jgi:VanZ family protein